MSALSDTHLSYLGQRAVTPEIAKARGYRTANQKSELANLGFGQAQRLVPALVVPIWAPWAASEPVLYQHRPDTPRRNG
jgi:hypothetical protein